MKITIGDRVFDGNKDIVMIRTDFHLAYCNGWVFKLDKSMVEFTDFDKENIRNMKPGATVYCVSPDKMNNQFRHILVDMMNYFRSFDASKV